MLSWERKHLLAKTLLIHHMFRFSDAQKPNLLKRGFEKGERKPEKIFLKVTIP